AGTRPAPRAVALAGEPRPPASATVPAPATGPEIRRRAAEILTGRDGTLSEADAKHLLSVYGVASPPGEVAADADAAAKIAGRIGYPVVCKVHAAGVAHKSDVGGVEVGLADENALRDAVHRIKERTGTANEVLVERMAGPGVELIVGGRNDAAGSLVVIGAGGVLTELLDDAAALLWPFGPDDVKAVLGRLRIGALLGGLRGAEPADAGALAAAAIQVGRLLADFPEIAEIDVNPLLCRPDGCLALDALIVLAKGN
ncbi:CoA-binding protein, partial [Actinomadura soli]